MDFVQHDKLSRQAEQSNEEMAHFEGREKCLINGPDAVGGQKSPLRAVNQEDAMTSCSWAFVAATSRPS